MKPILLRLIESDTWRMQLLRAARAMELPDWCIAAGFVRNLVWDYYHGYQQHTALNDIDLIYFDASTSDPNIDRQLERKLQQAVPCRWSVKNQARMHARNQDPPYRSTVDAMRYWPEMETAVGVKLETNDQLTLISPFALDKVLCNSITINPNKTDAAAFQQRLSKKGWLTQWPHLTVNA